MPGWIAITGPVKCGRALSRHRKLDPPGVLLASVYWLVVLAVVLFLVTYLALLFDAFHSPALLEKLRSLVQTVRGPVARP